MEKRGSEFGDHNDHQKDINVPNVRRSSKPRFAVLHVKQARESNNNKENNQHNQINERYNRPNHGLGLSLQRQIDEETVVIGLNEDGALRWREEMGIPLR